MKTKSALIRLTGALLLLYITTFPSTLLGAVTLTGDPTTTTGVILNLLGNSQDFTLKADSTGAGYAYNIYSGGYTVSAEDSVLGTNIVGNTAQGATGGSFSIGDQIMVIGWKATTPNVGGSSAGYSDGFLKFDQNLNGTYQPASAPGGAQTSFSNSDPGDFQLQTTRNNSNSFKVSSFRFYQDATHNNTYPLQVGGVANGAFIDPIGDLAFRTFGINVAAPASAFELSSQLILLNITQLNSQSFGGTPVNDFGPIVNFYIFQGNNSGKTGAVIKAAGVPEPTTAILLILGVAATGLHRRVRQSRKED